MLASGFYVGLTSLAFTFPKITHKVVGLFAVAMVWYQGEVQKTSVEVQTQDHEYSLQHYAGSVEARINMTSSTSGKLKVRIAKKKVLLEQKQI